MERWNESLLAFTEGLEIKNQRNSREPRLKSEYIEKASTEKKQFNYLIKPKQRVKKVLAQV